PPAPPPGPPPPPPGGGGPAPPPPPPPLLHVGSFVSLLLTDLLHPVGVVDAVLLDLVVVFVNVA
ncbi:MAG: hypothetical protein ACI9C2_000535, partial [Gammaproteobacteria bacterium]